MMYYRNKIEIMDIDPDSLWYYQDGLYILADEDNFISVDASDYEGLFYKVNDPFGE